MLVVLNFIVVVMVAVMVMVVVVVGVFMLMLVFFLFFFGLHAFDDFLFLDFVAKGFHHVHHNHVLVLGLGDGFFYPFVAFAAYKHQHVANGNFRDVLD